jgi:tetratricopeptide (TPR) repeat protein
MRKFYITATLIINVLFSNAQDSLILKLNQLKGVEKMQVLHELFLHYEYVDLDSAEFFLKEGFQIATELNDINGLIENYLYNGYLHDDRGEYHLSIKALEKSLSLAQSISDSVFISKIENNLGIVKYNLGDYPEALKHYQRALRVQELFIRDSLRMFLIQNNIGNIYLMLQEYDKSLENYYASMNYFKKNNLQQRILEVTGNMSYAYQSLGKHQEALDILFYAIVIAEETQDIVNLYYLNANIASVYNDMSDFDKSLNYNQKAYQFAKQIGNKYMVVKASKNLGQSYYFVKKYQEALSYLNDALELSIEIGAKDLEKDVSKAFSVYYEMIGDYNKALNFYKKFSELKDIIFNESKSKEIGKLEATFEMEKKQVEEERLKQEQERKEQEEKERRDNIQYSLIFLGILLVFGSILGLGFIKVSPKFAEGLIFFAFLIFFEFCLVLLDPIIEDWSSGEPIYKLLFNALLAGAIFPLHAFFERLLKQRIVKK